MKKEAFYLLFVADVFSLSSVEHPAAGYRKIFETVEELNEPIPAKISGKECLTFFCMCMS